MPSATQIAEAIRQDIYQETQLTASAGVSVNKFLAKVASGLGKPNGLFLIPPPEVEAFIATLPITQFYGVGQVTAARMYSLGIHTGADLKQWAEADLIAQFGKVGQFYYRIVRGQDERPVVPNRTRKSIGAENSFDPDLSEWNCIVQELHRIALTLQQRLENQPAGRTLTLKVKYADYQQITRSKTLLGCIDGLECMRQSGNGTSVQH